MWGSQEIWKTVGWFWVLFWDLGGSGAVKDWITGGFQGVLDPRKVFVRGISRSLSGQNRSGRFLVGLEVYFEKLAHLATKWQNYLGGAVSNSKKQQNSYSKKLCINKIGGIYFLQPIFVSIT